MRKRKFSTYIQMCLQSTSRWHVVHQYFSVNHYHLLFLFLLAHKPTLHVLADEILTGGNTFDLACTTTKQCSKKAGVNSYCFSGYCSCVVNTFLVNGTCVMNKNKCKMVSMSSYEGKDNVYTLYFIWFFSPDQLIPNWFHVILSVLLL